MDDYEAKDWMIYPLHASESDAWLEGELDEEVTLIDTIHPDKSLQSKLDAAFWKLQKDSKK